MELKRKVLNRYCEELLRKKQGRRGCKPGENKAGDVPIKLAPWQDITQAVSGLSAGEARSLYMQYAQGHFPDILTLKVQAERLRVTGPGVLHFTKQLYQNASGKGGLDMKHSGEDGKGVGEAEFMRAASVSRVAVTVDPKLLPPLFRPKRKFHL